MATALGTVGIADKGTYSASATYQLGNFVYYNGSSYLCIKAGGVKGVTPSDDKANWKFLAKGLTNDEVARVGFASTQKAGTVKVGEGLDVKEDGTVSVKKGITWGYLADAE